MDPNDLRDCVAQEVRRLIEPVAWERCEVVNKAEQELAAHDPVEVARMRPDVRLTVRPDINDAWRGRRLRAACRRHRR